MKGKIMKLRERKEGAVDEDGVRKSKKSLI